MSAKRIFDIVFSAALLVVVSPLMLLIALLIKLSSPGPAVYRADRAGKDFQRFEMLKFRTMSMNHDRVETITTREDPRIFPLGRILRKTKMDELPQLVNVLKGEMSVVGPRPEDYAQALRLFSGPYRALITMEPGLTSPASLFDYTHGETVASVDEYVECCLTVKLSEDLRYIENRSFRRDVKIIIQTAWTILLVSFGRKRFRYPLEANAL